MQMHRNKSNEVDYGKKLVRFGLEEAWRQICWKLRRTQHIRQLAEKEVKKVP